jgi:hypothetical protein
MTGKMQGGTFDPASVYIYTDANSRTAQLTAAGAERAKAGDLMGVEFINVPYTVLRNAPDPAANVYLGMNLIKCQQYIRALSAMGTADATALQADIQAAVDAWLAAGN